MYVQCNCDDVLVDFKQRQKYLLTDFAQENPLYIPTSCRLRNWTLIKQCLPWWYQTWLSTSHWMKKWNVCFCFSSDTYPLIFHTIFLSCSTTCTSDHHSNPNDIAVAGWKIQPGFRLHEGWIATVRMLGGGGGGLGNPNNISYVQAHGYVVFVIWKWLNIHYKWRAVLTLQTWLSICHSEWGNVYKVMCCVA